MAPETTDESYAQGQREVNRVLIVLFAVYLIALAVFCIWQHSVLFAWPAGIVTGNLLASCIWAPLAVIHIENLQKKHHLEHMSQLKAHHQEQMRHVKALVRHHGVTVGPPGTP